MCSSARAAEPSLKNQCLAAYAEAQELRLRGSLLAAREKLLTCTQQGCPGPVVNDCSGWLSEVDGNLSSVVFAVSDQHGRDIPEARVSVEGQLVCERTDGRAVALDPGTYAFTFEAPGYVRTQATVAMRQSEKNRIVRVQLDELATPAAERVPIQRAPAPHLGVPIATFILGGAALASAGVFAYFGLTGLARKHEAERCSTACQPLIDDGRRNYVIADVALGIAVASASAALLVWLLQPTEPAAKDTPTVLLSPSTAELRWSARF